MAPPFGKVEHSRRRAEWVESYPPDVDRRHEEAGVYALEQDVQGFVPASRVPIRSVMRAGNGS